MDYTRLILLAIIVLVSCLLAMNVATEGFIAQQHHSQIVHSNPPHGSTAEQCRKKWSLSWGPDPSNFNNPEITTNNWAKGDEAHCRHDSQCQSGKCNGWYC